MLRFDSSFGNSFFPMTSVLSLVIFLFSFLKKMIEVGLDLGHVTEEAHLPLFLQYLLF